MESLSLDRLKSEARSFFPVFSTTPIQTLYGVTDGKAIGTYVEHRFYEYLSTKYQFGRGSSAQGIDFPDETLLVDLKVTSARQPQSSCPFRNADQKVYGLGYHLLLVVYDKLDDVQDEVARLSIENLIFITKERTADYQTTTGLVDILSRNANLDDVVAFLEDRNLPLDEIGRESLAKRILEHPPQVGYLTISNALQWRLQYRRVIDHANQIIGLENLLGERFR
jgi:restriction system protein